MKEQPWVVSQAECEVLGRGGVVVVDGHRLGLRTLRARMPFRYMGVLKVTGSGVCKSARAGTR